MKSPLLLAISTAAIFLSASSSYASILPLEGRLPATPGGTDYQAYYDPNLDITWAANANINGFALWNSQVAWVSSLTIGGISDWRLPSADVNGDGIVVNCFGGGVVGCEDNEMGFLFWEEGITRASPGPFSNIGSEYWTGTEVDSDFAWIFRFTTGNQVVFSQTGNGLASLAWAVRSGDVAPIPIPAAFWLFGSGALAILGFGKRRVSTYRERGQSAFIGR